MNYKKHYDLLMERSRNRILEGYIEKHHIIPKCLGGTDDKNNLALLTPEEHFLAHQLLVKIYPNSPPLINAAVIMTTHHTKQRTNNKLFGWLRRRSSQYRKEWLAENGHPRGMLRKNHSDETKLKISIKTKVALLDKCVPVYAYNLDGTFYKEYISITDCAKDLKTSPSNVKYTAEGNFGHCRGKQLRYTKFEKILSYQRKPTNTYVRTENHKDTISKRFMEMTSCIHCGMVARKSNISRWHNNNCKFKLNLD